MQSLHTKRTFLHLSAISLVVLMQMTACKKNDMPPQANGPKPDLAFYALTANNELDLINARSSDRIESSVTISGLQSGESIMSIDFRPATGQLYGLGSSSRLYTIQLPSGKAIALGTMPFTPMLNGMVAGFDFNPTVDRIRVVTNTGQNLRLHPELGTVVATDGSINGVPGAMINAVAYNGNRAGSTSTTLFDIDITTRKLYKQIPPNAGGLQEVGDLGIAPMGEGGFDISPDGSMALAALNVDTKMSLYRIDLQTGRANPLGALGKGKNYIGIAIPTDPVAFAIDEMNRLVIFNPMTGDTSIKNTNLPMGEQILGIDFRPANGQLYALSSGNKIYTVNTSNGMLSLVGSGFAEAVLSGTHFGFDFNPTVDRIRVVSDAGQNLRLHPDLGTVVFTDGNLNPGMPMVSAAAYTNNFAGTTTTQLFVIDGMAGKLYLQDPPNAGGLVERGSLGFMPNQMNGFDIGGSSNMAFGLFRVGSTTSVYTVNLQNGMASKISNFKGNAKAMAVGPGF